jgi:hypothetical protein
MNKFRFTHIWDDLSDRMGGEFYLGLESYRIRDAIEIKKANSLNELVLIINTYFSNITEHALKVIMNTCLK